MIKEEKGKLQILAISIDNHEESKQFIKKISDRYTGEFDFPLLQERNHQVIDRYGLLNPTGQGWPHPATFVIDPQGVVRWKFVETDPSKRPTNKQILQEFRKIS